MNFNYQAIEAFTKPGILIALVVFLLVNIKEIINRLFKIIENNTEAMTKTAAAILMLNTTEDSMKDVISKCDK